MRRSRAIIAFIILVAAALAVTAAILNHRSGDEKSGISVVATIFPAYDFARAVAGTRASVTMLLPPGTEVHSYEPKPSDVGKLSKADLFIYVDEEMEPWATDIAAGLGKDAPDVLEAGHGCPVRLEGTGQEERTKEDHAHEGTDPHIWLDFENAAYMIRRIAARLSTVDPDGSGIYERNAENYIEKLSEIDKETMHAVADARSKVIVHGGHYAFGYFSHRYGLEYYTAQGFSPDSEPGPKQIMQLIDLMKTTGAKYVFYEELIEPKVAEAISKETGAGTLMLHAGHNITKSDFDAGITFADLMRRNLEVLKVGLGSDE